MPTGHRRTYPGLSRTEIVAFIAVRVAASKYVTPLERAYMADSGLCWLCSAPVLWGLSSTGPDSATLDHVIPKSAGGPGKRDNLRLAHQRCNQERGDRVVLGAIEPVSIARGPALDPSPSEHP